MEVKEIQWMTAVSDEELERMAEEKNDIISIVLRTIIRRGYDHVAKVEAAFRDEYPTLYKEWKEKWENFDFVKIME